MTGLFFLPPCRLLLGSAEARRIRRQFETEPGLALLVVSAVPGVLWGLKNLLGFTSVFNSQLTIVLLAFFSTNLWGRL